ncbi:hypothetical protein A9D14_03205 [Croceicoccus marinus]|uniref:Uncharacterized protein n=2 Tax=Croceicoccus marinus TaxID=450378 RepID=A0A1Z1F975_9SPHN|nr:hypothetical protein A9D14_03205 [Croceicoccus marinus]
MLSLAALLTTASAPIAATAAFAQGAAETAVILSGSAQTGSAQRSLGRTISGSVGNAAHAVGSTARVSRWRNAAQRNSRASSHNIGGSIPAGVDPLANTDAATYTLDNGATIRVSGRFNPSASSQCQRNCAAKPQD